MNERTRMPRAKKLIFEPISQDKASVLPQARPEVARQANVGAAASQAANQPASIEPATRGGDSLSRLTLFPRTRAVIQPKLTVGAVGDPYEQEADQVAAQVMSMPAPMSNVAAPLDAAPQAQRQSDEEELQMKPLPAGVTPLQRAEAEEEELQMQPLVQRAGQGIDPGGSFEAGTEVETQVAAKRGGGHPLSEATRAFMEPRFGADFSGVRVHDDGASDNLNRALQARAFATGRDIFFRQGEYQPGSSAGQHLLAHELTHVVQQTGSVQPTQMLGGRPDNQAARKPNVARQPETMIQMTKKKKKRRRLEERAENEEGAENKERIIDSGVNELASASSPSSHQLEDKSEGTTPSRQKRKRKGRNHESDVDDESDVEGGDGERSLTGPSSEVESSSPISSAIEARWKKLKGQSAFFLPKGINTGAACWNWALTALSGQGLSPDVVFGYLNGWNTDEELGQALENQHANVEADQRADVAARFKKIKDTMAETKLMQRSGNTVKEKFAKAQQQKAKPILEQAVTAIVEANGFAIVGEDETNISIVMQYKLDKGVSSQHWWLKYGETIIETVPGVDVQIWEYGPMDREDHPKEYGTITVPIQSLKPGHVKFLTEGMAKAKVQRGRA